MEAIDLPITAVVLAMANCAATVWSARVFPAWIRVQV
jgi:hypothetical protein